MYVVDVSFCFTIENVMIEYEFALIDTQWNAIVNTVFLAFVGHHKQ